MDNWHIGAISHALEEMRAGEHLRQIINMPLEPSSRSWCPLFGPPSYLGTILAPGLLWSATPSNSLSCSLTKLDS